MGKRSAKRHRVFLDDARRNGSYLRTTWHPERRVFVVSTWTGDVCTGAVRVPAADASELVALMVDGLAELAQPAPASAPAPVRVAPPRSRRGWQGLRSRLRDWLAGQAGSTTPVVRMPSEGRPPQTPRRTA